MTARSNFVWPVLIVGIGVMMLLISADVIPEAYGDLLIRAWPVLLMMFGLNVLWAGRIRFANWVIFALSIGLVVVIANLAYAERRNEYRTDYRESWQDLLPAEVSQLVVNIETKETLVTLSQAPLSGQVVVQFEGSTESDVDIHMTMNGAEATLNINEKRSGILPKLSEVGRGRLDVFLPADVFIQELNYMGDDGSVTFDLSPLLVRRLNIQVKRGNMKICLPQTDVLVVGDQIRVDNGDLRMIVPTGSALNLNLGEALRDTIFEPPASANDYNPLITGYLEKTGIENNQFNIVLDVIVEGTFILDHISTCQ